MTKEDFDNIQNGQKVKLIAWSGREKPIEILTLDIGDVLVRKKDWLDDDLSIRFDKEDGSDYHWFYADEIELIEEVQ